MYHYIKLDFFKPTEILSIEEIKKKENYKSCGFKHALDYNYSMIIKNDYLPLNSRKSDLEHILKTLNPDKDYKKIIDDFFIDDKNYQLSYDKFETFLLNSTK